MVLMFYYIWKMKFLKRADGGGPNYGTQQPSAPSSQAVAEYSSSFGII